MNESNMPSDLSDFLNVLKGIKVNHATLLVEGVQAKIRKTAHNRLSQSDRLRQVMTSEDLAQDVFLDLADAVEDFRGTTWNEFYSFTVRILERRKIRQIRHFGADKRGAFQAPAAIDRPSQIQTDSDRNPRRPISVIAERETLDLLKEKIEGLPEHEREALKLRLDRMGYEAIGECLGISPDAARQRVSRAIQRLGKGI